MSHMLHYYHPRMPVYLVGILQQAKYSPKIFIDLFCKFPDLTKVPSVSRNLKGRLFIVWGYYVWVVYVLAGLIISLGNIILGAVTILCTPLLVAGSLSILAYVLELISHSYSRVGKNKNKP